MAAEFGVLVDGDHDKVSWLYWLPKLHRSLYNSRLNAKSSSCTTTELSIL